MNQNILTVPKGRTFKISAINLEEKLVERLFAMGIRIDCLISVVKRYHHKILVQISEELKIVLDENIASGIFIK